ncbi:hypothetical protein H5410_036292 [Solanum commersonii]|uniref:Uncharacterized protein n=1 Tax=Solanum commersonii TaxID=4109 RepID=A0A9J5Y729_SOLCO|nr:hypothetical protein H5410_036292 [Solanum commersonii]
MYNTQPYYNPPQAPAYQNPPRPYVPVQAPIHQNTPAYTPRPRPNPEDRNAHAYTPLLNPMLNCLRAICLPLEILGTRHRRLLWFEEPDRVFDQERSNQMHSSTSQCEQQSLAKP